MKILASASVFAFACLFAGAVTLDARADAGDEAMGKRVQDLLHAHQSDVYLCVQKATPAPVGGMLIRVFVGEGGTVGRAEVLKDQASGGDSFGPCLLDSIRKWNISALRGAEGDQVVFPLAFKPNATAGRHVVRGAVDKHAIGVEPRVRVRKVLLVQKANLAISRLEDLALVVLSGEVSVAEKGRNAVHALSRGAVLAGAAGWNVDLTVRSGNAGALVVEGLGLPRKDTWPFTVRCDTASALAIANGRGSVRLCLDPDPSRVSVMPGFALDLLSAERGVEIKTHRHERSEEILYIVQGRGVTIIEGVAEPFGPEDFIYLPAGVEHSVRIDEPLEAVQIYAPGGPEQRFKPAESATKMSETRVAPRDTPAPPAQGRAK